jgi:arylsulfatase A-like enzyme
MFSIGVHSCVCLKNSAAQAHNGCAGVEWAPVRAGSASTARRCGAQRGEWTHILLAATLAVAVVIAASADTVVTPRALAAQLPPPAIVVFLTDDQRPDTLEYMPVLQRELVSRGIVFNRAYATTPHCCPSRASILTGLYAHHHGVIRNQGSRGGWRAFDDRSTIATWLQAAGMRTVLAGKYLNLYQSPRIPPGWADWFALWDTGQKYHDYTVNQNGDVEYYPDREALYSTRVLRDHALEALRSASGDAIFIYLSFDGPHVPAEPTRRDRGTFADLPPLRVPSFNETDVDDKPSWVRKLPPVDDRDSAKLDDLRHRQIETLQVIDRSVGTITDELRAQGRLESSWLVFASDNGLSMGEHRYGPHKSCGYEECVRIPLIIAPPRDRAAEFGAPRIDEHLVSTIDLAPTFADIAGIANGHPVDGVDLIPMLAGQDQGWRAELGLELWTGDDETSFQGLRADRWKYIRYFNGEQELYDLGKDPYELENLAGKPEIEWGLTRWSERLDALLARPPTDP